MFQKPVYLLNECSFRGTELIDRLFIIATDEDKINLVWKKASKLSIIEESQYQ